MGSVGCYRRPFDLSGAYYINSRLLFCFQLLIFFIDTQLLFFLRWSEHFGAVTVGILFFFWDRALYKVSSLFFLTNSSTATRPLQYNSTLCPLWIKVDFFSTVFFLFFYNKLIPFILVKSIN